MLLVGISLPIKLMLQQIIVCILTSIKFLFWTIPDTYSPMNSLSMYIALIHGRRQKEFNEVEMGRG